jgi:hypothetical protein
MKAFQRKLALAVVLAVIAVAPGAMIEGTGIRLAFVLVVLSVFGCLAWAVALDPGERNVVRSSLGLHTSVGRSS